MNTFATRLVLFAVMVSPMVAQAPATPTSSTETHRLKLTDIGTLKKYGTATEPPWLCDADGNLYGKVWSKLEHDQILPLYKFSPKGTLIATYNISKNDAVVEPHEFALGRDGQVVRVTQTRDGQRRLISYSDDGTIRGRIRVQTHLGWQYQQFDSGELLLAGQHINGAQQEETLVAVLRPDGTLLKNVALPRKKSGNAGSDPRLLLARGPDGNVYIATADDPGTISVVNSSGEVVKSFGVAPPKCCHRPDRMVVNENSIAIQYDWATPDPPSPYQTARTLIKVVDLDGHDEAVYYFSKSETNTLVCHSNSGSFTLLEGDTIVLGEPQ